MTASNELTRSPSIAGYSGCLAGAAEGTGAGDDELLASGATGAGDADTGAAIGAIVVGCGAGADDGAGAAIGAGAGACCDGASDLDTSGLAGVATIYRVSARRGQKGQSMPQRRRKRKRTS